MSQLTVQQSYLWCKLMVLWYWELMSRPDPAVLPVGTLHSLEWFWISRRIFINSYHNTYVFFSKTSVCRQGFRNFLEKLMAQFISYLAFTLMGWISWPLYIFLFLSSFSTLWWPNIWPKMGFLELFEKTIGSIHFTPGIYPHGVGFLTPLYFRVTILIFGPQGLALLTLSWDKNWDSHSLVNGYPSFYPRIALVAPSAGGQIFGRK